jgi:hypothetical protein
MKLQDPRRDVDPHKLTVFDIIFWVLWIIAMAAITVFACMMLYTEFINRISQ